MNLFPKIQRPYFIYTPSYTDKSSGVKTLHLLCHALNEVGQTAYIIPDNGNLFATNPVLNTPLLQPQHQNFYAQNLDPIVIYPDIVIGNPLNAKHVVRYLLAPRGAYGGDSVFPDTDQIWGALPSIANRVLRLPVCDSNIFYNSNTSRLGSCFYSHKYQMYGHALLDMPDGCEPLQGTQEQIADILRKKEVCYLYEVSSILTEAALCGCPVVLMRTAYFNTVDPTCMMGNVKWSDGEIVKECVDYLPEYQREVDDFHKQIGIFIQKTQGVI